MLFGEDAGFIHVCKRNDGREEPPPGPPRFPEGRPPNGGKPPVGGPDRIMDDLMKENLPREIADTVRDKNY